MEEKGKILAKVIIEMLGAPKEHIEKALKDFVERIKKDEEFNVVKEDLAPAEEQEELFTTFAELDIWFKTPQALIDFCFDAMPSSVEIIEPTELRLNSKQLSDTLNDLQAKIHRNDMVIKNLTAQKTLLDKNAKGVVMNFIYFLVKDEEKDIKYLSEHAGIKPEHLKPFISELIKAGKITEKEGKYGRAKQGAEKEG